MVQVHSADQDRISNSDAGSNVDDDDDKIGNKMLETLLKSKDCLTKDEENSIADTLVKIANSSRLCQDINVLA